MKRVCHIQQLPKIYVVPNRGGHFVDNLGRIRMFRGINIVEKGFPWYVVRDRITCICDPSCISHMIWISFY